MNTRSSQKQEFAVGDCVSTIKDGSIGIIRFLGETQFATGRWVGLELHNGKGKNDGSVNDVQYFTCKPEHGLFLRENQISAISSGGEGEEGGDEAASPKAPSPQSAGGAGGGAKSRLEELKAQRAAVLQKLREDKGGSKPPPPPLPLSSGGGGGGAKDPSPKASFSSGGTHPTTARRVPTRASMSGPSGASAPPSSALSSSSSVLPPRATASTSSSLRRMSTSAAAAKDPATTATTSKGVPGAGGHNTSIRPPSASSGSSATRRLSTAASRPSLSSSRTGGDAAAAGDSTSSLGAPTSTRSRSSTPTGSEDGDNVSVDSRGEKGAISPTLSSPGFHNLTINTAEGDGGGGGGGGGDDENLGLSRTIGGSGGGDGSDARRRISLGAKEADLTSQVAGLKTLLVRKNAELETLKQKADEGIEAIKSEKVLRERLEKVEKERDEIKAGLDSLQAAVQVLRKEAARNAEARKKQEEGETSATDTVKARCAEYESITTQQAQHLVELEAEVRALKNKAQYAQEDEKAKWAELAKEKAAAATGARRVTDLEAQLASLNDMVELLTLDKEQLLIDKELLDERVEELGLEVETLKLELEHAEFTSAAGGEEGGASEASGGHDAQALAEQNGRLRAALKKLQEISSQEKQDLLRRQRELEREVGNVEASNRQLRELKEWKAIKEKELEDLHEMVEAGQAFESMVESLTSKNLELEEKVADLSVAVCELEVAQELSEELEEQHVEEAAILRKELERAEAVLTEREMSLKAMEARLLDRETTLTRFRTLVGELTEERNRLRERVDEGATALGQARDKAQDVLDQVQSLRAQAKATRSRLLGEATAKFEARSAKVKLARLSALIPREILDREATAMEGDLVMGRIAAKAELALDMMTQGFQSWLLDSPEERKAKAGADSRQESPAERLERAAFEGRVGMCLSQAQRLVRFLLLRMQHPALNTSPDQAQIWGAEAASLLVPLERVMDDLLTVLQEEGGVPEAHFSLHGLEEALVQAESISLLRDGGQSQGHGHTLWTHAAASASLKLAPLLALFLVVQASTLMEEQGERGGEGGDVSSVDKLREMAREASKHVARCLVRVGSVADVLPSTDGNGEDAVLLKQTSESLEGLSRDFIGLSQGLRQVMAALPSEATARQAASFIMKASQEWASVLVNLQPNSIQCLEGVEVLFAAAGPSGLPQEARAMKVKKRLMDAMEMGPLLDATKESERRLAQDLRGKEREQEALRAKVDTLENLLHKAAARDQQAETMVQEVNQLRNTKEKLEKENHVLSEALEVVQQQADALESENRKLKSLRAVGAGAGGTVDGGGGGNGASTPRLLGHSNSTGTPRMAGGGAGVSSLGVNDMPLVATAAMATLDRVLSHMGKEVAYWRAKATRQGLLQGLKPLGARPMYPRPGLSLQQNINPETTGHEEGSSSLGEEKERVQRAIEEAGRLAARLRTARSSPRVVSLSDSSWKQIKKNGGKEKRAYQQIESAKLANEYRRFREGVDDLMASLRPASLSQIKGAPILSLKTEERAKLVGRIRLNKEQSSAAASSTCIPVRVGDHHLRYLAATFA